MKLTVEVTRRDSAIEILVNGEEPGHSLSRKLTGVYEAGLGIFSIDDSLCFRRGHAHTRINMPDLPERPDANAPEAEWREWAIYYASIIKRRIFVVKSAFREDFNFTIVA